MKVRSFDGTIIDCGVAGSGPPLLIVPGTGDNQRRFSRVREPLGEHFSVHVMDRRGRGASGDTDDYSFSHDIHDIAAVLSGFSEPVHLLGHSHGARCSMEAALSAKNVAKLILYEPPIPKWFEDDRRVVVDDLVELAAAGDREGIVETYLRDFFGTPKSVIENQRNNPEAWARWIQMAHTIPRELIALRLTNFEDAKFNGFAVPTRILTGTESRPALHVAAERVRTAIDHADIVELPGEGHIAMTTAPKMFVKEVLRFFLG